MNKQQFLEEKKKIIEQVNRELDCRTTYAIQKGGISSAVYKKVRLTPEKMNIETLYKLLDKLAKIKKQVIK